MKIQNIVLSPELTEIQYPVGKYISANLPKIAAMIKVFKEVKEYEGKRFNFICSGSSGAIIAALFSAQFEGNCTITHIKKKGESSHSEGAINSRENDIIVLVDDFISSGNTVNFIYSKMKELFEIEHIHCVVVTAKVVVRSLKFTPDILICKEVELEE